MNNNSTILTWLNDAFAMEQALIETLEAQIKQAHDHPDLQDKLNEHLDQTHHHADLVKQRIRDLGGSVSRVKSILANLTGTMQGASTMMTHDQLVKDALADYAAEHYEIAAYRAIMLAAEQEGDAGTITMCQAIIPDEKAMAQWLNDNMATVVEDCLVAAKEPA